MWLLSPLGGQSSLRILGFTNTLVISQGQIHFFDTFSIPDTSIFSSADDYSSSIVGALLDASLMQTDQIANSPVDQWNNVKIPRLQDLSPFTHPAPGNPWISVNQTTTKKAWSSLTGLMIQQLPGADKSNFTLESAYLDIACSNSTRIDEDLQLSYKKAFPSGLKFHNASWPFSSPSGLYQNSTSSFFMDTGSLDSLTEYESSSEISSIKSPLNLLYGSNLSQNKFMDLFNCSVMTARVESDITCHGSFCTVNRMRRSEIYTMSPFYIPFGSVTYQNMLLYLPFAMGVPHAGTISPIENYLLGSDKPLAGRLLPILADFSAVTGQVFSERLTTIVNTVWQASLALGSIPLGAKANYTAHNPTSGDDSSFPSKSRTTTINTEISVYAANHLFCIILVVIALILQVCAIFGLVLKYTATAPDILGYVSTMTMENPHIKVPSGGNTLDGIERARYLQKVKVQLADVYWDQVQGHVALRTVENEVDFAKGKLSKKKYYIWWWTFFCTKSPPPNKKDCARSW